MKISAPSVSPSVFANTIANFVTATQMTANIVSYGYITSANLASFNYQTASDVNTAINTATVNVPKFVANSSTIMTIEALHTNYPPAANTRSMYAYVNNYGSSLDKILRCSYDSFSGIYFWCPSDSARSVQTMEVTANTTLDPLITGDIIDLTGNISIGITRTITLSLSRGYPGDIKTIKNNLTTLAGTLTITGTGLGAGIANILGSTSSYYCSWDTTLGSLKWTRLT